MNNYIYFRTGVKRPETPPSSLEELGSLWNGVRLAASSAERNVGNAVNDVLRSNEGEAARAFHLKMTGGKSSVTTLERLARAALQTRDAHDSAAAVVDAVHN